MGQMMAEQRKETAEDLHNWQIRNLPNQGPSNPLEWALDKGYVPTGNYWFTPEELANLKPPGSMDVLAWLKANQTAVLIGAAVLLLFALSGGRRR